MRRALRIAGIVAIATAVIAALHYGVSLPLRCEARVTRAFAALDGAADGSDAAQHRAAVVADAELRACRCLERHDFKLAYARGTILQYRGDAGGAIVWYRRALLLDRRPEVFMDLGRAQLDAFDRAGAIESFATAGSFAPAVLARIPYDDVRAEAERRIRAQHGHDALP